MRMNKQLFILVMVLLLNFTFCGGAQSEEYEAVGPYELSFSLTGFIGKAEVGEDGVRIFSGTFDKLLCEGEEIAVVTNKSEAGIIQTRDYGKIKVSAGADGGLIVHIMPSQKKKLLKNLKQ